MDCEQALLQVPLEALRRSCHLDTRRLEKEWSVVHKALDTLKDKAEKGEPVTKGLEKVEAKLRGVKRKLAVSADEQAEQMRVCCTRARLMDDAPQRPVELQTQHGFYEDALNRVVAEYLVHQGCLNTATTLAEETGVADQVNVAGVAQLLPLVDALREGDVQPALNWCGENRSRLRSGDIELKLRTQRCVALATGHGEGQGTSAALEYCRQHVSPLIDASRPQHLERLRLLMGAIASAVGTGQLAPRYAALSDPARVRELAAEFAHVAFGSLGLAEVPTLLPLLQAGLLCLRTERSSLAALSCADPMSDPDFQALAEGLPVMARKNSALVCRVTGRAMGDANPPMVTPQGEVYSSEAVREIAARNEGYFVCPRTGASYPHPVLKKLFVM